MSRKELEENPRLVKFTQIIMSRIKTEAGDEGWEPRPCWSAARLWNLSCSKRTG